LVVQVANRGIGGGIDLRWRGGDAEAGKLGDVVGFAAGSIVGEEGVAQVLVAELGQEGERRGEEALAAVERAVEVEDEVADVGQIHRESHLKTKHQITKTKNQEPKNSKSQ
jgi:hypothetical protein